MKRRTIAIIIIVVLGAALAGSAYLFLPKKQTNAKSEEVMSTMEQMIPNFGQDQQSASGFGRDPLVAMPISGIDIVGGLEIPAINLRVPVTAKGLDEPYFATWVSGSPVKGKFCISGNESDIFSGLSKCKPGEKVYFTDVDGVRYEYQVTTQFHLKDWDKANHDLMLVYRTDSKTKFVLACKAGN